MLNASFLGGRAIWVLVEISGDRAYLEELWVCLGGLNLAPIPAFFPDSCSAVRNSGYNYTEVTKIPSGARASVILGRRTESSGIWPPDSLSRGHGIRISCLPSACQPW